MSSKHTKSRFNIYLDKELHKKAKAKSALLGMTFSQFIDSLIKKDIESK